MIQTYDLQEVFQDPAIYPDPQRWDPGRFLSDRAEYMKEYLAFCGFGAGRRKCRECASYIYHDSIF